MSLSNPENIIQTTMRLVESNENSHIRLSANGGNSILIVCEPLKEIDYIKAIQKLMTTDKYEMIDLNQLLCEFVKENKEDIEDGFELLKGSIHQIFKTPNGEEGSDLLGLILQAIANSLQENKIPVLINPCHFSTHLYNLQESLMPLHFQHFLLHLNSNMQMYPEVLKPQYHFFADI